MIRARSDRIQLDTVQRLGRAAAIFPNQADAIPFGKDRSGLIKSVKQWYQLTSASPADVLGPRPAGAMIGASAAGTMGPILLRKLLTEPWGRALSRRLGTLDTAEADRYLQTPGTKNLLEKMLFSLSAIGANRVAAGSQQTR